MEVMEPPSNSLLKEPILRVKEDENSPETKEFLTLEKELLEEDEDEEEDEDSFKAELLTKLEERKKSRAEDFEESENGLQLMERRQFRSFSRADEYLYAMKEDLSEWLNLLYDGIGIHAENFMDCLETGEHLVKHANAIRAKHSEIMERIASGQTRRKVPNFSVPEKELPLREKVASGSWFARDNVFNFIQFCRYLGVMDCIMFETEDLVCRKNEKHVILTLLEVARRGAKLGMLAPILVQFEQEIDREIAMEEKELKEKQRREEKERKEKRLLLKEREEQFNSLHMKKTLKKEEETEISDEEEDDEDMEYNYPIGPLPQLITNDLKSLDEMVRELVSDCQCPTQFPMIRVSEGKYRIGESKVLIFVRILRNHVMVRVGGGWDTLQHYLDKHDPCRCKLGHKATLGAHMTTRAGKGPMAVGVCYDRSDSPSTPGTPRRRSSATNLSNMGRRSSSVNPLEKGRSTSPRSSSSRDLLHKTKGYRKVSTSSIIKQQQCLQPGIKSMSDRSDSSCSIPSTSNLGDSGSEVSDEGYKILPSLTVGSDCSSTISSDTDEEDDKTDSTSTWLPPTPRKKKSSPTRSLDGNTSFAIMNRSQSINSVHSASSNFSRLGSERRSYRTPVANSRYMQAAEAYASKRGTPRTPTIAPRGLDPRRNYARSSSASPSPYVRSSPATTPQLMRRNRKQHHVDLPTLEALGIDGEDDDVLILKKMEEILLTYKSRVEGRLAAEGRQLPKEIFEDFTSHWVNSTSKPPERGSVAVVGGNGKIPLNPPTPRKEFRDKKDKTKIPVPTFYSSQSDTPHR
ncbi:GAS2-like protein 1,GAS2-like protein 2,GAS2-like protein pickled eggs [Lepeophtheirus salmonis]|uniref:GAS2-like protein 1,GAS2-like protein 2,GAS2-like protein pickled eggs n=1 Tax=Lepeophtheirus salmonis TaxID=72036 RepID=A0A7R8CHM8_LEPSM|nr:GAS2-like protein 1,GAS2-like protein 2,GAS2-like protein pickled eggs [Lepeophtheirus salmonis]CAF2825389.1 GAS2-like protein 1,GAS2-like protein 2,GAS2-like protein pickled eggs [Lepeophtheirus salmonis]